MEPMDRFDLASYGEHAAPTAMDKPLAVMTVEVRELNTAKGWRAATNTVGEYVALLHSEASEILESYRDRRLDPYTTPAGKPDDVGSEAADVFIRLLDTFDVVGIELPPNWSILAAVPPMAIPPNVHSFGDAVTWLHWHIGLMWPYPDAADAGRNALCALVAFCGRYGINLAVEYERKMAYNWTRPFQHGGRTLADTRPSAPVVKPSPRMHV